MSNTNVNEEDDDIFIECNPVDTFGDEDIIDQEDNTINIDVGSKTILDDVQFKFSRKDIYENVGFQVILGIGLLAFIYFVADYVFKRVPKHMVSVQKRNLVSSFNAQVPITQLPVAPTAPTTTPVPPA